MPVSYTHLDVYKRQVYLIPQVYSVLFPAKTMQDTYWYVFIGILFIVSGNYFPKNHINPYVGLKFPWLFNDEEGWYKTHRLGSYTWILAGICLLYTSRCV